jgi:hypothetical protein
VKYAALVATLLVTACQGKHVDLLSPDTAGTCETGVLSGEMCVPDFPIDCHADEIALDDGTCKRVGTQVAGCPLSVRVGGDDCVPNVSPTPCLEGTMAVPGQISCVDYGACNIAWGGIPSASTIAYVVADAAPGGDGTLTKPFTRIADALASVAGRSGALVAIASGTYAENLVLSSDVRLWGACAQKVILSGASTAPTITVSSPADSVAGSSIENLTITGGTIGILADHTHLGVRGVRVHGTGQEGLWASESTLLVDGTLVDGTKSSGIVAKGSTTTITGSLVRNVIAWDSGEGFGVRVLHGDSAPKTTITTSVIEESIGTDLYLEDGEANVIGAVLRGAHPAPGAQGMGLIAQGDVKLTIDATLFFGNEGPGLSLEQTGGVASTTVRRSTFRFSTPGIRVLGEAKADVSDSTFEQNNLAGIEVLGSATIERCILADTFAVENIGAGVHVAYDVFHARPSDASITESLVTRNLQGIYVEGSTVTATSVTIDRSKNEGLSVQRASGEAGTFDGSAVLQQSLVERGLGPAVRMAGGTVSLLGTLVSCNANDVFDFQSIAASTFRDVGGSACGCDTWHACTPEVR